MRKIFKKYRTRKRGGQHYYIHSSRAVNRLLKDSNISLNHGPITETVDYLSFEGKPKGYVEDKRRSIIRGLNKYPEIISEAKIANNVDFAPLPKNTDGVYDKNTNKIQLNITNDDYDNISGFFHEARHAQQKQSGERFSHDLSYEERPFEKDAEEYANKRIKEIEQDRATIKDRTEQGFRETFR